MRQISKLRLSDFSYLELQSASLEVGETIVPSNKAIKSNCPQ